MCYNTHDICHSGLTINITLVCLPEGGRFIIKKLLLGNMIPCFYDFLIPFLLFLLLYQNKVVLSIVYRGPTAIIGLHRALYTPPHLLLVYSAIAQIPLTSILLAENRGDRV